MEFLEEIAEQTITNLFEYIDILKLEKFKGNENADRTLEILNNRIEKIVIAPNEK